MFLRHRQRAGDMAVARRYRVVQRLIEDTAGLRVATAGQQAGRHAAGKQCRHACLPWTRDKLAELDDGEVPVACTRGHRSRGEAKPVPAGGELAVGSGEGRVNPFPDSSRTPP